MSASSESAAAAANVRPWQSLASLGVTESDLTTVHHRPRVSFRFLGERSDERRRHPRKGA
ncbi:hypothetical protein ACFQ0X_12595 [Streptomyces rectiviolaceus]|uniref:Uncharacterized protein n=1 Tax=Streptomyces rectiviolaceus TaxID=332591 RepID=A0ABP6MVF3_9ACTN